MYAKLLTKDKTKDTRTLEDILTAWYDNGDLLVPCVQLQCIGFDDNFFTALLAQRDVEFNGTNGTMTRGFLALPTHYHL